MLKDEHPWLYELGIQLYRAIEDGNPKAIERARRTIVNTIEMTHRGPFMEMMGYGDDEESMMAIHHLVHSLERFIRMPKRSGKSEAKSSEKGE